MGRRIISKVAKIKCGCGHTGDHTFSESRDWTEECPKCGKKHNVDGTRGKRLQDFGGNRRFHGSERLSVTEGWHPSEVAAVRPLLEPTGARVHDSGQVEFKDRQTQRAYMAKLGEMKRRGMVADD